MGLRFRLFLIAALGTIFLLGSYAALVTGITYDTEQEQRVLVHDVKTVRGWLNGDQAPYQALLKFSDKYYGIGFDAPASVVQSQTYKQAAKILGLDQATAFLAIKQWLVFDLFFLSTALFFLLSRRLTGDSKFSALAALGYLLWPYLLGQSFIDVKDVPCMFAWFVCLYVAVRMAEEYCTMQTVRPALTCLLAILTGWLMSIRIGGSLILLQYSLIFIGAWKVAPKPSRLHLRGLVGHALLFALVCLMFIYLAYPVFWPSPLRIFEAVENMRHHPLAAWGHWTLTLGEKMFAAYLPVTYLPGWLSVKLPLAIIAGYLLLPVSLRKAPGGIQSACLFKPLVFTSLGTIVLLWLGGTTLYNEMRHILFLMPLFFFVGIHSIYLLSRKVAQIVVILSITIFAADNILAFPYNYVWVNEIARQFSIENYFETDYWGSSGRPLARKFMALRLEKPFQCAYIDGDLTVREFLRPKSIGCVSNDYPDSLSPRPLFIVSYTRKGALAQLPNCVDLEREQLRLLMGKDIVLGRITYCP